MSPRVRYRTGLRSVHDVGVLGFMGLGSNLGYHGMEGDEWCAVQVAMGLYPPDDGLAENRRKNTDWNYLHLPAVLSCVFAVSLSCFVGCLSRPAATKLEEACKGGLV